MKMMVLEILKRYADKHQEHDYLSVLVPDIKKTIQPPPLIQMIGESVKKNWWFDLDARFAL